MSTAVVFTHLDERNRLERPDAVETFYAKRGAFFRSCLLARNIHAVFVYSSFGVEQCLELLLQEKAVIPMDVLETEERIYNALQIVLDWAREDTGVASGPEFVFVGVRELACHLQRLRRFNPKLLEDFAWKGKFTYDSPKYVEAMIRIANEHETIIRVDADVQVNEAAVARLIAEVEKQRGQFWWFSGCYSGDPDDPGPDPVNEHAVRQHWLVTPATRPRRKNFELFAGAEHFLADIAEIGATQYAAGTGPARSPAAMRCFGDRSRQRLHAQVISGAGLVASCRAVQKLPPFVNAKAMVVWIDDHLKRLLHEAIGDIGRRSLERITDARFRQDRFPDGISEDWVKGSGDYFERLLRGCMMERTIAASVAPASDPPDPPPAVVPGPLAVAVHDFRSSNLTELPPDDVHKLNAALIEAAGERYDQAMALWSTADYGDDRLKKWAEERLKEPAYREQMCVDVADIGVAYVNLYLRWADHVGAMRDLDPKDAYWLFVRRPREETKLPIRSAEKRRRPPEAAR